MLDLLLAIQSELRAAAVLGYVGDNDIFISDDDQNFPAGLVLPAIGIEDGDVSNERRLSGNYYQVADVLISIYQRVNLPGESVTGTGDSGGLKGVRIVAEDLIAALIGNRLGFVSGPGQVMCAFPVEERCSERRIIDGIQVTRKTIVFSYHRAMHF